MDIEELKAGLHRKLKLYGEEIRTARKNKQPLNELLSARKQIDRAYSLSRQLSSHPGKLSEQAYLKTVKSLHALFRLL
jgi:hypothetical protein